jgi:sugar lactone lactonase YvrE
MAKKEKMHKTVGSIKEKLKKLGEDMERRMKKSRSSMESVETDASGVTLSSIGEGMGDGTPDSSVLEQEGEVVTTAGGTARLSGFSPDAGKKEELDEVPESTSEVTFTKNEYFVGGTSLSSTTLMTHDGVVLF